MTITCPQCYRDVSASEVERMFDGETFSVFQCVECMKTNPSGQNTFVLLPGGSKVPPGGVRQHLQRMARHRD